ncbi:MAG: DUF1801 domain-containing protein [Kaistella sp.]|nr:DUF1801 domain-containing protein [Kaistella sp.]
MNDVDRYITLFPEQVQEILSEIRTVILKEVPDAEEKISYGMPGYYLNAKPLVYFAAYKNHIGFYATPTGHEKFEKQLAVYKQGKGSVQFPLDNEIPYKLIAEIVKFREDTIKNK